jgi:hypothetical protein
MVKSMVQGYIKKLRSVTCCNSCKCRYRYAGNIGDSEEVDPHGQRTLGVLTKPDLVDKGAEMAVVDLIKGRRQQLAVI